MNQAEEDGATPLIMACGEGRLECARLLLEASAAVGQAMNNGITPLLNRVCGASREIFGT